MNELPHGPWEKGYEPSCYSTNQVSAYPQFDWEAFRRETSVKVLIAMLRLNKDDLYPDPEELSAMAVYYTDMLIESLKEER